MGVSIDDQYKELAEVILSLNMSKLAEAELLNKIDACVSAKNIHPSVASEIKSMYSMKIEEGYYSPLWALIKK